MVGQYAGEHSARRLTHTVVADVEGFQRVVGHQCTGQCATALISNSVVLQVQRCKLGRRAQAHC
jgi:hypothetical protein|eukprot:COSAG06_NODE_12470_length_1376_cov_16.487079_2_plen_64_part_00